MANRFGPATLGKTDSSTKRFFGQTGPTFGCDGFAGLGSGGSNFNSRRVAVFHYR